MKLPFIKKTKQGEKFPKWYYGKIYENYDTNTAVWTIVGFHTILKIMRYIRQAWNVYRGRKTWFDKQWLDAYDFGFRKGYFKHAEEVSHSEYLLDELRLKLKLTNNKKGQHNELIN